MSPSRRSTLRELKRAIRSKSKPAKARRKFSRFLRMVSQLSPELREVIATSLLATLPDERRAEALWQLGSGISEERRERLARQLDPLTDPRTLLAATQDFFGRANSDPAFALSEGLYDAVHSHQATVSHVVAVYSNLCRSVAAAGAPIAGGSFGSDGGTDYTWGAYTLVERSDQ